MDLLVVGHVTRDEIVGGARLGGAASYAARAAACLGYETALVTVAPPDDPLLEPLRQTQRLSLHCAPSEVMTTFALAYTAGQRQLWLRRRARALVPADIPLAWRRPRVAYVGPVAGECDLPFALGLGRAVPGRRDPGLAAPHRRGRPRRAGGAGGGVRASDARAAGRGDRLPGEIHPEAEAAARRLARTAAITRGARGARLIAASDRIGPKSRQRPPARSTPRARATCSAWS